MKVKIIKDIDQFDISKGTKIYEYEFDGNKVMPWYINCISITHTKDGLTFRLLDKFIVKKSYSNPEGERLWIMGVDKVPITEQIEMNVEKPTYERIM